MSIGAAAVSGCQAALTDGFPAVACNVGTTLALHGVLEELRVRQRGGAPKHRYYYTNSRCFYAKSKLSCLQLMVCWP